MDLRQALKNTWFRLRGVEPGAVIVSIASGPRELAEAMAREALDLMPGRRHFLVTSDPDFRVDGTHPIVVKEDGTAFLQIRRALHGVRVGMMPVLFTSGERWRGMRWAAICLAPRKVLAVPVCAGQSPVSARNPA
jgi:hypothetical protein